MIIQTENSMYILTSVNKTIYKNYTILFLLWQDINSNHQIETLGDKQKSKSIINFLHESSNN